MTSPMATTCPHCGWDSLTITVEAPVTPWVGSGGLLHDQEPVPCVGDLCGDEDAVCQNCGWQGTVQHLMDQRQCDWESADGLPLPPRGVR